MKRLNKVLLIIFITLQGVYAEGGVKSLTIDSFKQTIESNNMVIVKFFASWCGACEEMKPKYESIAKNSNIKVLFTEVDIDKDEELSAFYKVESIPTTILFKEGKEIDRYIGGLDEEEIELFIDAPSVINRYRDECSKSNGLSCQKLALIYDDGVGTKVDKSMARDFYEKACDLGQIKSCFNVAYMYDIAEGIKENNAKALKLYTKACEGDQRVACHNLAIMYEDGEDVKVDNNLVIKLYTKACKLGYGDACYNMALIYEKGKIVEKDLEKTKKFYKLACDNEDDEACQEWKKLSK